MRGRWAWVEDPPPKPVSATVWVPLAKKHRLTVDFHSNCVSPPSETEPYFIHFWGSDHHEDHDVGACVVRVADEITQSLSQQSTNNHRPSKAKGITA